MTVEKLENLMGQCMELLSEENYVITIIDSEPLIQNFFNLNRDEYFLEFSQEEKTYLLKSKFGTTVERVEEYESLNVALKELFRLKCSNNAKY